VGRRKEKEYQHSILFKKMTKMAKTAPKETTQKIPRTIPIGRGDLHTAHVRRVSSTTEYQFPFTRKDSYVVKRYYTHSPAASPNTKSPSLDVRIYDFPSACPRELLQEMATNATLQTFTHSLGRNWASSPKIRFAWKTLGGRP
jgi:hypothetical protein